MERYIGGDVHAASVTFSVRNASAKVIRRDVVETNGVEAMLLEEIDRGKDQLFTCVARLRAAAKQFFDRCS